MAGRLGSAVFLIDGNNKVLLDSLKASEQGVNRFASNVEEKLRKVSQGFVSVGKKLSIGLSLPLAAIGISSIKAASDLEETRNKARAVFRDLATEVEAWANVHAFAAKRAAADILRYMNTLQDTFVPLGYSRKEGMELSKTLTKLAIDLGSFNNINAGEALQSLQSALVGNHETVRRYGIILTEANIQNEIFRLGLAETKDEITDMMKVQARMSLILKGSKDAMGDAERTAGSFANKMREMKAVFGDVREEIGDRLISQFDGLIRKVIDLGYWFKGLDDSTKDWIVTLGGATVAVGPTLTVLGRLGFAIIGLKATLPVFAAITAATSKWAFALAGTIASGGTIGIALAIAGAVTAGLALASAMGYLDQKINTSMRTVQDLNGALKELEAGLVDIDKASAGDERLAALERQKVTAEELLKQASKYMWEARVPINMFMESPYIAGLQNNIKQIEKAIEIEKKLMEESVKNQDDMKKSRMELAREMDTFKTPEEKQIEETERLLKLTDAAYPLEDSTLLDRRHRYRAEQAITEAHEKKMQEMEDERIENEKAMREEQMSIIREARIAMANATQGETAARLLALDYEKEERLARIRETLTEEAEIREAMIAVNTDIEKRKTELIAQEQERAKQLQQSQLRQAMSETDKRLQQLDREAAAIDAVTEAEKNRTRSLFGMTNALSFFRQLQGDVLRNDSERMTFAPSLARVNQQTPIADDFASASPGGRSGIVSKLNSMIDELRTSNRILEDRLNQFA